jgi:hypothetical protein
MANEGNERQVDQHHEHQDHHGNPRVEVLYLNTNAEVKFHASWSATLQRVWDEAYKELKEAKRPNDQFECQSGQSLMGMLSKTLEELRKEHVCQDRKFQIRSETGGAEE